MAEHSAPLTEARLAKRLELVGAKVTLNGQPAQLSGSRSSFATLTDKKTGLSAQYAWETVERIVGNGGHFLSY